MMVKMVKMMRDMVILLLLVCFCGGVSVAKSVAGEGTWGGNCSNIPQNQPACRHEPSTLSKMSRWKSRSVSCGRCDQRDHRRGKGWYVRGIVFVSPSVSLEGKRAAREGQHSCWRAARRIRG